MNNKKRVSRILLITLAIAFAGFVIYGSGIFNLFFRVPDGKAYIAPYSGERYHTFKNCAGLKNAQTIVLAEIDSKEVGKRTLCGYCRETTILGIENADFEAISMLCLAIVGVFGVPILLSLAGEKRRENRFKQHELSKHNNSYASNDQNQLDFKIQHNSPITQTRKNEVALPLHEEADTQCKQQKQHSLRDEDKTSEHCAAKSNFIQSRYDFAIQKEQQYKSPSTTPALIDKQATNPYTIVSETCEAKKDSTTNNCRPSSSLNVANKNANNNNAISKAHVTYNYSLKSSFYLNSVSESHPIVFKDKNLQQLWDRGVRWLFHFTNAKNLSGISNYGIVSRQQQNALGLVSESNDVYELNSNYISTSIEWPNYRMFWSVRQQQPLETFVVICISISVLANTNYEMYYTNARTGWGASKTENVSDLYYNNDSRDLLDDEKYPTDPQAEIRIKEYIPMKYIKAVYWENGCALRTTVVPESIRAISRVSSTVFEKRIDSDAWRKKDG